MIFLSLSSERETRVLTSRGARDDIERPKAMINEYFTICVREVDKIMFVSFEISVLM